MFVLTKNKVQWPNDYNEAIFIQQIDNSSTFEPATKKSKLS